MNREQVQDYFKGKKVTVMGLGLLGRGIGDTAFLASCGAEVIVTDLKTEAELKDSLEQLKAYANITFVLGEHRLEDFENRDFILKAAGVPLDSKFIAHARQKGVPIEMSASLFARLSGVPIIGITGTRGKSTVTHMIHHVLSEVTGEKILLGGNVRGLSNLQLFNEMHEDALCVMELDSWQLQGFGDAGISPHIAVFTNFMDDHLNYYKGDTDAYFADKANIFLNQEESDVFITTPDVFTRAKEFATGKHITLGQEVVLVDASVLPEDAILSMPGEHNRLNAALAYEALKATSLTDEEIFAHLATFPGVEGRLQYVGERDGVKIYNDNNATTPAATVEGLRAVGDVEHKNVILIAGGADKEIDVAPLAYAITKHCKRAVLTPGSGTDKLLELLHENAATTVVENLTQAFEEALLGAEHGDVILFSPAFASFAQYKNEYERNDEFIGLVQKHLS